MRLSKRDRAILAVCWPAFVLFHTGGGTELVKGSDISSLSEADMDRGAMLLDALTEAEVRRAIQLHADDLEVACTAAEKSS